MAFFFHELYGSLNFNLVFQALWMKFAMPKFPKPDISEISSYFIITVSSSLVAFFWALWKLSKIVPNYNWDKCFTVYLSDYYLKIRYQLLDDELPEFLGAQIEATDYPEPEYHIDGECLGVLLKPFGQAFVYGLSFGLLVSLVVCAVKHTPRKCWEEKPLLEEGTTNVAINHYDDKDADTKTEIDDETFAISPLNQV